MGALFFLVYGGTNWITSWRTDVGTLYFPWELRIPFIPILIIPYMSIDLFFIGSFFLCTNNRQLHTLAKRVVWAILLSGAGFLAIPLRFAFERPRVSGLLGTIFGLLGAFDRPYNLIPSLHISLLVIIWAVYRGRTRGWLRIGLDGWFMLIAASTLFTYQHHVLDVGTGALVGILAFRLIPDTGSEVRPIKNSPRGPRWSGIEVGSRYAVGAIALSLTVYLAWPWAAILIWPALSLAVVAVAYFGAGTSVFRKTGGLLPQGTWLLLAPYLWGVKLSHAYYGRGRPAYAVIHPGVLIGRRLSKSEAEAAIRLGVRAVLDLTAEASEATPFLRLPYRNVQILDLTVPTLRQVDEAIRFIQAQRPEGTIYIHCSLGYSRSACIAAAFLVSTGLAETVEEAVQAIRRVRPEVVMHEGLVTLLEEFLAESRKTGTPARPFTPVVSRERLGIARSRISPPTRQRGKEAIKRTARLDTAIDGALRSASLEASLRIDSSAPRETEEWRP
jgi:predicted protein tyrosine phosphatase/membrane-associated phospholipid phosphatase